MKTNVILLHQAVYFILLYLGLSFHDVAQAQMRVGQPSGSPDGSAALDVSSGPYSSGSPYRGLLPPKVTLTQTTQAAPITNPATGLLVYNTAKIGDVTPGYYYWEGNRWIRLSTGSNSSSARVAAAGNPIPAYTYSEAKGLATPPGSLFMLTEPGQEGLFRNANTPTSPGDTASANGIRDTNGNILNSGTIMMVGGQRYKRVIDDGMINVKWFGAVGQADATDDAPAIQKAVNYAKSILTTAATNAYRATVLIPPGFYRVLRPINATQCTGLLIKGSGGRGYGSVIVGNTGGIILDFTGSTLSGCEDLSIHSYANEPTPSTIGVQFALNVSQSAGGLVCTIRNCFIQMADLPSANNGLGTIGIINCQAEEFAVTDCLIHANLGCIFSYKSNLSEAGLSFTISSTYATVSTQGSMGVVNFSGQNSIKNFGKIQPAVVLNGTNSVNFHGYLGRLTNTGSSSNEAAVLISGPSTYNVTINSTVESFAQLLRVKGPLSNSTINGVVANQVNNSSVLPAGSTRPPVIDFSGANPIRGCKISIQFGNGSAEMGGRYLLYEGGSGTAQLLNDEIICSEWGDNNLVANTSLLNNTQNTSFKTAQPFEKKLPSTNGIVYSQTFSTSGWVVGNYTQIMPTGTLSPLNVYVIKVFWWQNGVDQLIQSYILPMSGTDFNGSSPVLPVLNNTTVISWSNNGRQINVRYKAPISYGQTTYGLEASINKSDMNNGTLVISISPLL